MKRSDMVTLIQNSISVYLNDCYSKETATQIASTVLDNIEKSGMLPPEYIVDHSPMITTNAWEPEDEEK